jgi:hypothetical protein
MGETRLNLEEIKSADYFEKNKDLHQEGTFHFTR